MAVCCSSPERFLSARVSDDASDARRLTLESKPIKGTAARRPDCAVADAAAARALAASEKAFAENLMIADLLRNDLERVCEPGATPRVSVSLERESHAKARARNNTVGKDGESGTTQRL